ncbi:MAG: Putative FeS assembly ATPase SufC [Desulfotomaculum sp. 46_296]|nr:MAG: Putative FeS assembly ATPase SufC [Desulfotomaculum sp. 46_296]HAU30963.1 ABC transporter ATP-binding protein [Desulfotomaculum sp.]
MLRIENLKVSLGDREVLKEVNLEIKPGEVHVLFGPNGSGKTSLLMTLMGFSNYRVTEGTINFKGRDITGMSIDERARLGIGMSFQRPPTIKGLKTRQMVALCSPGKEIQLEEMANRLNFESFLDRDLNSGFSGGEIKRSELLQLMAQNPDLILLDEPESGVDLESISLIGEVINELLERKPGKDHAASSRERRSKRAKAGLLITHTGYILNYVDADVGHVLYDGFLSCHGNPRETLRCIQDMGYQECMRCMV